MEYSVRPLRGRGNQPRTVLSDHRMGIQGKTELRFHVGACGRQRRRISPEPSEAHQASDVQYVLRFVPVEQGGPFVGPYVPDGIDGDSHEFPSRTLEAAERVMAYVDVAPGIVPVVDFELVPVVDLPDVSYGNPCRGDGSDRRIGDRPPERNFREQVYVDGFPVPEVELGKGRASREVEPGTDSRDGSHGGEGFFLKLVEYFRHVLEGYA